jgi:transcriptional regulator with XRE-family HTH domain
MGASSSNTGVPGAASSEENWKAVFSERLRKLREAAGQTQRQVAEALGFSSESVYQLWEKPDGNLPSAPNLRKLALHFDVSVDYLLGMKEQHADVPSQNEDALQYAKQRLFQLALQGHGYDSPEVAALYPTLRRSLREPINACYKRVITDFIYPASPNELPRLERFRTSDTFKIQSEIERLFRERPAAQARHVTMYVLDLDRVPSLRLQRIILGMQGAELIKQRHANFTLAVSNGRMARNVLTAPNLVRGDIEDVLVMPLTLGRTQVDPTAATVLVRNFAFVHADYGVSSLKLRDVNSPQRVDTQAHAIGLAFMGIGSVNDRDSLFIELLAEKGWSSEQLKRVGVIGNVLYHLIREEPGPSWSIYEPPPGKEIAVDLYDPVGDEVFRSLSLVVLRKLLEIGEARIVVLANEPARAPIIRAALEMRWANTVICTLEVARALNQLLT